MAYDCSKCVVSKWCKTHIPLIIGEECMRYWELKTHKIDGIDFYNMAPEDRQKHPKWQEMTPSEKLSAISIGSRDRDNGYLKPIQELKNRIFQTTKKHKGAFATDDFMLGYKTAYQDILNLFNHETQLKILEIIDKEELK